MINRFYAKENNYEILTDLRKTEFWDELDIPSYRS